MQHLRHPNLANMRRIAMKYTGRYPAGGFYPPVLAESFPGELGSTIRRYRPIRGTSMGTTQFGVAVVTFSRRPDLFGVSEGIRSAGRHGVTRSPAGSRPSPGDLAGYPSLGGPALEFRGFTGTLTRCECEIACFDITAMCHRSAFATEISLYRPRSTPLFPHNRILLQLIRLYSNESN